jgi:hypothetical protein
MYIDFLLTNWEQSIIDCLNDKILTIQECLEEIENDYKAGETDYFGYNRVSNILRKLNNKEV